MQDMLPGFDEIEAVVEGDGISPEEARRISEESRRAFESMDYLPWMTEYAMLRQEGWPWRVACYIAWAMTPRKVRWPGTQEELASMLGLRSDRTIRAWRQKNPQIDARVASLGAGPLLRYLASAKETLGKMAVKEDYKAHQDRKLYFEMVGVYTPRQEVGVEHSGGMHLSADEMAQAKKDVEDWERERFGDGDDADGADVDTADDD